MTSPAGGEPFGRLPNGDTVSVYTLRSGSVCMRVLDYGGIVQRLETPDRHGASHDIVLGFDSLDGYLTQSPYFGALIGRYANRIAGSSFMMDGVQYTLAATHGRNSLHGGAVGFDKVLWRVLDVSDTRLVLRYVSQDGDEGYPGTLTTTVTYTLSPNGSWQIDYEAITDKATPVNLTQHSYFNLRGNVEATVLAHELQLHADCFTPVNDELIPTGAVKPVDGTPFDFRVATPVGARIEQADAQLLYGVGYDHNFVLRGDRDADGLTHAARVVEPVSGRTLDVHSTEPGLQFYSGNFLDGSITGKNGVRYGVRSGFCLETQRFPDSPHHPSFPSTLLRPGETYRSRTVYTFGVLDQ